MPGARTDNEILEYFKELVSKTYNESKDKYPKELVDWVFKREQNNLFKSKGFPFSHQEKGINFAKALKHSLPTSLKEKISITLEGDHKILYLCISSEFANDALLQSVIKEAKAQASAASSSTTILDKAKESAKYTKTPALVFFGSNLGRRNLTNFVVQDFAKTFQLKPSFAKVIPESILPVNASNPIDFNAEGEPISITLLSDKVVIQQNLSHSGGSSSNTAQKIQIEVTNQEFKGLESQYRQELVIEQQKTLSASKEAFAQMIEKTENLDAMFTDYLVRNLDPDFKAEPESIAYTLQNGNTVIELNSASILPGDGEQNITSQTQSTKRLIIGTEQFDELQAEYNQFLDLKNSFRM